MNTAKKWISWRRIDATGECRPLTRAYCVEHIYPRILYNFSDILCYIVQTNPRDLESIAEQLIMWADNVHQTSLNQATLPRAVLVLNNIPLSTQDEKDWSNEKWATEKAYKTLTRCTVLSPGLTQIAERWNEILPPNRQINSVMDLLRFYYKSLSVVYIPPRNNKFGANGFFRQIQRLRASIHNLGSEVMHERTETSALINSETLESILNDGLNHFFTKFGEPFDFFKHAITHKPSHQDLVGYATTLLMEMRENEHNNKMLDERCAKLFASYRCLMLLTDRGSFPTLLNDTVFTSHYRSAYEEVYRKLRCWYQNGGRGCRNTADGHEKGHQDRFGLLIGSGDYQTPFTNEAAEEFIRTITRLSDSMMTRFRAQRMNGIGSFLEKHLETLAAERAFWLETFSNTICYCCIREAPDFTLKCQHTICRSCVKLFSQSASDETVFNLKCCPLCREGVQNRDNWAQFRLKPALAGVRVLAIDGGGVRGTISVRILEALEKEIGLGLPLAHFFDVIMGTSSGGIISLGLGANLWSATKCREVFENLVKTSFVAQPLASIPMLGFAISYLFDSYYRKEPLEKALDVAFARSDDFEGDCSSQRLLFSEPSTLLKSTDKSANPLQQILLRDIKVGVTTVNALSNKTTIMSNYNRKRSDENSCPIYRYDEPWLEIRLPEAARCTSAAPYIFPLHQTKNGQTYQDGGLNENNPVALAVREASSLWSDYSTIDIAVSVGTGWTKDEIERSEKVIVERIQGNAI
ncbi:uncharacterized protein N7496_010238 [Penicillium cataractarum]|uniref:FabD/lysophospholipase-like protein n=1 Tax=Penicillium cataractarum TaxID=2100454 RepID=A0A9W9V2X0_9EURO|nr:uncharacterized protein N7496_010238 [Penicillium cataractarum]KAJ5364525.1 hypothetical protein N7496_010238 [Penicillium cataractarum]